LILVKETHSITGQSRFSQYWLCRSWDCLY